MNEDKFNYDKMCIKNLSYDIERRYTDRIKELNAWFPLEGVLHITSVGVLQVVGTDVLFRDPYLNLTRTTVGKGPLALFTAINILTHKYLTYTDIFICIRKQVTLLLKRFAIGGVLSLEEYPEILMDYLLVNTRYEGDSVDIVVDRDVVGFKEKGQEDYIYTRCSVSSLDYIRLCASVLSYTIVNGEIIKC